MLSKFFIKMKIIRFIYFVLALFLVLTQSILHGQQTPKTNYYGFTYEEDVDCFSNTRPSADDLKLERFITQMLEKIGTKNRITIKSCQSEENCAANIKDGVPYILYNPNFLKNTKVSLDIYTTPMLQIAMEEIFVPLVGMCPPMVIGLY